MPGNLFGISRIMSLVSLSAITETVTPIPSLPVYYLHSFEQPFCADACCTCHARQQEAVRLFVSIIEGRVELEQAAPLLETSRKEHRA